MKFVVVLYTAAYLSEFVEYKYEFRLRLYVAPSDVSRALAFVAPSAPSCIVNIEPLFTATVSFTVLPVIFAFFTTNSPLMIVVCEVKIVPA